MRTPHDDESNDLPEVDDQRSGLLGGNWAVVTLIAVVLIAGITAAVFVAVNWAQHVPVQQTQILQQGR